MVICFFWQGTMTGFEGTPYANGLFRFEILFPQEYPFKPPKIEFKTKIYHSNLYDGGVHLDIIKDNYSPAVRVNQIILALYEFVENPDNDNPCNLEVCHMYKGDREQFKKIAKEWTEQYAI